jgi:hypothetical protein
MVQTIPWWVWLIPLARVVAALLVVLFGSIVERISTGRWPSLVEWCRAMGSAGLISTSEAQHREERRPE